MPIDCMDKHIAGSPMGYIQGRSSSVSNMHSRSLCADGDWQQLDQRSNCESAISLIWILCISNSCGRLTQSDKEYLDVEFCSCYLHFDKLNNNCEHQYPLWFGSNYSSSQHHLNSIASCNSLYSHQRKMGEAPSSCHQK